MKFRDALKVAVAQYNVDYHALTECLVAGQSAYSQLLKETGTAQLRLAGSDVVKYTVFTFGDELSRPLRDGLFIWDEKEFHSSSTLLLKASGSDAEKTAEVVDRVVYTTVMSVACWFDIWQRSSRKTPGTFFEATMGSLFRRIFPAMSLKKHVTVEAGRQLGSTKDQTQIIASPVPEVSSELDESADDSIEVVKDSSSVATDLVIVNSAARRGAVIPLKITTRERIVQPFAHQRILESAYPGSFKSFIACMSETQLDKKLRVVKQICVPNTIALYQKHLSAVEGLYYADIPLRYGDNSFQSTIRVQNLKNLIVDVKNFVS